MSTSLKTEGKCEVFLTEIDPFSRQSFTLGFISKQELECIEACKNGLFLSCSGYLSGILFFSQFDSFQTPWIFYP